MSSRKVLLFVKVPPPITGATLMNKRVVDSLLLHENFDIDTIQISYAKNVSGLGKLSFAKTIKVFLVFLQLLKKLIFKRPRIVYFQLSPLGIAFYRDLVFVTLIKVLRIKILYHLRGKGIKQELNNAWKFRLYQYAFRGEDIICLSKLLTNDIEDVFSGRIHVVNNGIPDVEDEWLKNPDNKESKTTAILFLSNLIISKGILDFIEALFLINKKGIDFEARIVGAESDLSSEKLLQILKEKELLTRVKYLGPKYGVSKTKEIYESDFLVFPTKMKHETFGNVNLEAMQLSKPIISTNIAAIPEIVDDGKTGYLVDVSSPDQIAEKIEILVSNPDLRRTMGEAARIKYEEKYTLQHFEENMKIVFEIVLNDINKKTKK